ncbi:MAG: glycosyltransferase, partial [Syntrophomonadaceae bacterium]|nr:glycosyltransferase [Syntrophomonadaceae bacterium]
KDKRIKVIHKINGGPSDARNVGVKAAVGEYILFVDGDDYLELDACMRLYKYTDGKPDIITGAAKVVEKDRISIWAYSRELMSKSTISGAEFLKHELKDGLFFLTVWMNLYRLDFLTENNLCFKYGVYHEDIHWSPRVFLSAKKVVCTDEIFYNYIIRQGSITQTANLEKNAQDIYDICCDLLNTYETIEDEELKSLLYGNLVLHYLSVFNAAKLYRKKYKHLVDKEFVRKHAYSKRSRMKAILFILSPRLFCYIKSIANIFSVIMHKI